MKFSPEILTPLEILRDLFEKEVRYAAIGIGFTGKSRLRDSLYSLLKQIGYELPVIIDKSAIVSYDAIVDEGTFIGKCASVNAGTTIGKMCIINTHAIVEHTNRVDNYSHVSVGATLCGDVVIEDHCFIGANATVIQGIRIRHDSVIGAGSIVLSNINTDTTCHGIVKGI